MPENRDISHYSDKGNLLFSHSLQNGKLISTRIYDESQNLLNELILSEEGLVTKCDIFYPQGNLNYSYYQDIKTCYLSKCKLYNT